MADIRDVTAVVASALTEISLTGSLDVQMDDGETVEAIGDLGGEAVEVVVVVKRLSEATPLVPVPDRF